MASSWWPRRGFWMKACPAVTTVAPMSVLRPRIGASRRVSCPWSASTRLVADRSMRCRRDQLVQHHRVDRGLVGDDLDRRHRRRADRTVDEPTSRLGVPPRCDEHVDDLPTWSTARQA